MGDPVYAVTSSSGLTWSATEGVLYAVSPADEIAGAGSGFSVLRFTASIAPGASGGALVDRTGALIGIITGPKQAASRFAVPIENVLGLSEAGPRSIFGSGAALQVVPPQSESSQASPPARGSSPKHILRRATTVYLHSKTAFLTIDTLEHALVTDQGWPELGLSIVQDRQMADLIIEIDRPLFTYVHTYLISDRKTSIVLGAGKVTAFDGTLASGPMAKEIVKLLAAARLPEPPTK
jgi:hypothetical protein